MRNLNSNQPTISEHFTVDNILNQVSIYVCRQAKACLMITCSVTVLTLQVFFYSFLFVFVLGCLSRNCNAYITRVISNAIRGHQSLLHQTAKIVYAANIQHGYTLDASSTINIKVIVIKSALCVPVCVCVSACVRVCVRVCVCVQINGKPT